MMYKDDYFQEWIDEDEYSRRTEGHTDWDNLKGMEAASGVFDDMICKPVTHTIKTKPLYTQLLGRWGK